MNIKTKLLPILLALCTTFASAQVDGNTHPEDQAVTESTGEVVNPFGAPVAPTMDTAAKAAFAKQLDLSELTDLAVFHNGRVKILGTLADETVMNLTGRHKHFDFLNKGDADIKKVKKVSFDPMFTMLDTQIDPLYYLDRPLLGVSYLPLRQEILRLAAENYQVSLPAFGTVSAERTTVYTNPSNPSSINGEFVSGTKIQVLAINGEWLRIADRNATPLQKTELLWVRASDVQLPTMNVQGWLKTGMISPMMTDHYLSAAFNAHDDSVPFRKAVGQVDRSFGVFRNGLSNLLVVAPEQAEAQWLHLGALPDDAPARIAAAKLADAWRAGDAETVNTAASELATALESIHPETYPTTRRSIEALYNKVNAFEWGLWIYLLSLVLLILAFGTGRKSLIFLGVVALIAAVGLHGFGFALRSIIAERFAIQNQFESMTGVSLFAAIVGTAIMLWRKQWLFGAAAAGTGFLVLITATQTGIPGEAIGREAAILNTSVLLKYHVTTVLTSYGLITLGFMCSLFYLGTHYAAKFFPSTNMGTAGGGSVAAGALGLDSSDGNTGRQRTLKDLDTATMTILQLAFWTLGVGILLGAWWADHSWGRWWAFDPKETWALVTWIVYLIVIHARQMQLKNRGLTTAWLSVIGFIVMLWTYFGVNLLLPGLHAYA